jgi:molybdopterin-guanine dinucleotide biosynthesis protein A
MSGRPVSAAIMAGGKSRRMGRDKAWLDLGDGRPIVQRVIEVMHEVADEVFLVANDERFATLGLRVVPDRFPEGGALGGITTGVGAATHDVVLVAACDMPFLRPEVFRLLVERSGDHDVVMPKVGEDFEALHALYTKACLPAMERALASGKMRIISFFGDVRVLELGEDELRRVDPELRSFTNVNTPEELEAARAPRAPKVL